MQLYKNKFVLQYLMTEGNLEKKIFQKKLSFLYGELPKGVFATLALGLILVMAIRDDVSNERLVIWYALTVFVSLLRVYSFFYFKADKNKEDNLHKHYRLIFAGTLASALIWGSSSVYIFPESDALKLFVIFCIAGLSAGATGSLSSLFKVYAGFVLVSVVPFIIVFSFEASSYALFISAALVLYLVAVSSTALKITQNLDKTLRLGYTNNDLVEELRTKAVLAEQAAEAKSMFLSTMSHEIRTPLNAIMGYISILRKNETDRNKQHQLEIIDNSSHLLLGVINDVLDFNKLETGKMKLEYIECDVKRELKQLVELFLPLCKEKGVSLVYKIDDAIPECILTDAFRLNQILNNLLSNAIKFTPKGKQVILKSSYQEPHIHFEVIDEGIGIDIQHQKSIFERFEQADSSTTRKYGGTGLGLSISYQLSLLFGSKLDVFSVLDKGSIFSFSIEARVCEAMREEKQLEKVELYFDRQKILVAEDNKTNQMLIKLILEDLNLDVTMANDGKEALQSYSDLYALVLMDINMPEMNGIEAMQAIKKKHAAAKIIAVTANALKEDEAKYLNLGFDGYLAKPIENDALLDVLRSMITSK